MEKKQGAPTSQKCSHDTETSEISNDQLVDELRYVYHEQQLQENLMEALMRYVIHLGRPND